MIQQLEASDEGIYSVVLANEYGSVTSQEAQLVIDSLIQIVQAPVNVTLEGEGTATLSVQATGPGLTYQWYRGESGDKSNPIPGATASTYETDTLSSNAQFWVEIKTGGVAQGLETVNSSTIEVLYREPARYFFGNVGPGNRGSFGLYIRNDDTAIFLANVDFQNEPFEINDMVVAESGYFEYRDSNETLVVSGEVTGETVSGIFGLANANFSGQISDIDGESSAFRGFYAAAIPNTSDGIVRVIVGPDGQSFVSVRLSGTGESGMGSIDSSGLISASLNSGYIVAASLDQSFASIEGALLVDSENYALDGHREDIEVDTQLFNTSIRGQVRGGSSTMIAGFVVGGAGTKKVLIRGLGPAMTSLGVDNAVSDPRIRLYRLSDNELIAENDDWGAASNASEISVGAQMVGAPPLASNSKDAAFS